ncbi:unnamed protein product [Darwinula stevensoni]|uniref:Mos1 transposase HTH domain-containing protein n=1 Tax=Darwinula stevensoni TaxID=69355 RepID=A0A7R9ADL8_9CRUS|nr:unnamed protein product [Darwinula stevensoni]CAG0900854.1 unnamed protein product [Darwinula stevensoni]
MFCPWCSPAMNQPYPLTKEQVRLLLYDFRIEKTAANSIADINTAFGPDTVSKSTAYDWYSRFQKGNESLEDQPRTGRPSEFDNSALQEALEANNRQTSRELADLLGVSHTTILHHLAELGKKANCWLSSPYYIWTFAGPVMVTILLGAVFMYLAIRTYCQCGNVGHRSRKYNLRVVRTTVSLSCLLGTGWVFGFLYMQVTPIFVYAFTIVNASQVTCTRRASARRSVEHDAGRLSPTKSFYVVRLAAWNEERRPD